MTKRGSDCCKLPLNITEEEDQKEEEATASLVNANRLARMLQQQQFYQSDITLLALKEEQSTALKACLVAEDEFC